MKNAILVALLLALAGLSWLTVGTVRSLVGGSAGRILVEEFLKVPEIQDGVSFGQSQQLTFELNRDGGFLKDSGQAGLRQVSAHYRDSAIIRSTQPLPEYYRVTVVAGEFEYGLDNLVGLQNDPEFSEGPLNENGFYLLAITDEAPTDVYLNHWWHEHRKMVIDVDNNVWGHGMPDPIFMVYFDRSNSLRAYDGQQRQWISQWERAVQFEAGKFYQTVIEKTPGRYSLAIADEQGRVLAAGDVPISEVWHAQTHPEFLVVGEPHQNYYQGSARIKSITIEDLTQK